jgi:ribosomal protein L11 methylase PrmA
VNVTVRVRLAALVATALAAALEIGRPGLPSALGQGFTDTPVLAPFLATPESVVEEMLRMAGVGKDDLVYDLGSGDGRIVIAAAARFGARAVGFEIDEKLVRESRERAGREGVADRVEFRLQDVMTVDLSPATVVTIYLTQEANLKLQPKLAAELRAGTRVVSHNYHMGDWVADEIRRVVSAGGHRHTLYLWRLNDRRPLVGPLEPATGQR